MKYLALAGGVGGAKLALGMSKILPPSELTIVVNTGDDEEFYGLHVSPDVDTVMYTLAGLSNPETGWGITGETFNALERLNAYGADTWFNLGDKDLATHIRRTDLLRQGYSLSEVTESLRTALGVAHPIVPMTDDPVRTMLTTAIGELPMQTWFVKHRCEPAVSDIRFDGAERAQPAPGFERAPARQRCPSLLPIEPPSSASRPSSPFPECAKPSTVSRDFEWRSAPSSAVRLSRAPPPR